MPRATASHIETDWNSSDALRGAPAVPLTTRIAGLFVSGRAALKSVGATPVADGSDVVRTFNLVTGLAAKIGLEPEIWTFDGPPNALVARAAGTIALARTVLSDFSRTELEATLALALVRLGGHHGNHPAGYDDDVRAVAFTRFPPGLAAALRKMDAATGRFARFYLAGDGPWHRPTAERIAALNDL